jgi:hypothetical protein
MEATLVESTRNRRVFELKTPNDTHRVEYVGGVTGIESVRVDGKRVAKQQRFLAFVLRFDFLVESQPALLEVRVYPWMSLRAVQLWVGGELVYAHGPGLLQSVECRREQEVLEKGRKIALSLLGCGVVLIGANVVNHFAHLPFLDDAVCSGPLCLLVGIAGLIDPRIVLGGSHAEGQAFPLWTTVIRTILLLAGFAVGMYFLVLFCL